MGALKRIAVERGALLGKYRLLRLLGTGGMAEVWAAKIEGPAGFERHVVVKRVLPHLAHDEAFVDMFLAEARLSAKLVHPNIVQVFDLGNIGDEYFMTMEHIDGQDLGRLLRAKVYPSVGMAAAIVVAICRALGHAHALRDAAGNPLGVVHRDVTPSNVMIGRDGTVRLLDFGIAKALSVPSEQRTAAGTQKGKYGYMAPEQVLHEPLDHRLDVFTAGIVLHELLSRRRLFKAKTSEESSEKVLTMEIPAPSTLNADVPPELDAICWKALARNRDDRYPDADAFADALEPFAAGWSATQISRALAPHFASLVEDEHPETVSGYKSPSQEPTRRTRAPWFLFAGAAVVVVAAAAVVTYGYRTPEVVKPPPPIVHAEPPLPAMIAPIVPQPAVVQVAPPVEAKRSHAKRIVPKATHALPSKPLPKTDTFDPESARAPR